MLSKATYLYYNHGRRLGFLRRGYSYHLWERYRVYHLSLRQNLTSSFLNGEKMTETNNDLVLYV